MNGWWILIFIISLVIAIIGFYQFSEAYNYNALGGIIGIIFSILCIVSFIFSIQFCIKHDKEKRKKKDDKYEICSLITSKSNEDKLKGKFILGFSLGYGDVEKKTNEKIYYYFYKKEKQGGWKLTKVNAYNILIFEDADKKPYYAETNKYIKDYDELHLPRNTIKKDINKIKLEDVVK